MIYQTYIPRSPLCEFVEWFWFYEGCQLGYEKERVLPFGAAELIIDLQAEPKRLFDREDQSRFQSFRRSWISGPQSEFIVIQATANSSMMGVHFKPGGAYPFFGFPITELCDSVVELESIWGAASIHLRDQLLEAPNCMAKFRLLEDFLCGNAPKPLRAAHAVTFALSQFEAAPTAQTIRSVAERLGVSHKYLIAEFGKWVGLTPKLFCRIRRFQRALQQIQRQKKIEWLDVAGACGYYDQAHFIHDFQAFSGLNPSSYLAHRGEYINHVPMREENGGGARIALP